MFEILKKLGGALSKTSGFFKSKISGILTTFNKVDQELINKIEELLIESDSGVSIAKEVTSELERLNRERKIQTVQDSIDHVKTKFSSVLSGMTNNLQVSSNAPSIYMFVGVNGTGKTTSVGKLANKLCHDGKKVIIAACDTFRAAAIEQLEIWAKRSGVEIVMQQRGADPASVCFDTLDKAMSKNYDYVLIDTAGRLQSKDNLMRELEKFTKVIKKKIPTAPHETLLTLDATTGQNALSQAKEFSSACNISGIVLTKLDGTAKGGIVLALAREYKLPVKLVGTGEGIDDIDTFNHSVFIDSLFSLNNL